MLLEYIELKVNINLFKDVDEIFEKWKKIILKFIKISYKGTYISDSYKNLITTNIIETKKVIAKIIQEI